MAITSQKITFEGSRNARLSAKLDLPAGPVRAYALFAHCFTCSKDLHATKRIATTLAENGIAVLRFDFTGLGRSDGDFASTNFSSNKEDLLLAADYMREHYKAPELLIGHSLGGAAVLSVAQDIEEVKAVTTIGAPSDASHVVHNFGVKLDEISQQGEAEVSLGGRKFLIRKQFLDDLQSSNVEEKISKLRKPLMVMHSPTDETVGIENASKIFLAAKHPKSFVSLDNIDHLVTGEAAANFVADMISAWLGKYVKQVEKTEEVAGEGVTHVAETGAGKFQNSVHSSGHRMLADEPVPVGGLDSGPTPYGYLAAALGACTNMTIRMYADFKKLDVGRVSVKVSHDKIHAKDCETCTSEQRDSGGKIDVFTRKITVEGLEDAELEAKLLEIADKCPVHKTLESSARVETSISKDA